MLNRGGFVSRFSIDRRAALALLVPAAAAAQSRKKKEEAEEEVTPGEDLMREHGVLKRVLLAYREMVRRLEANQEFPPDSLARSAKLIQNFIEEYHEKTEETFLFPRFRKAGKLVELVDTLERQHKAGRVLTGRILGAASAASLKDTARRRELSGWLQEFIRMYEPHEAREDTVLFPAFAKLVSRREYDALGEEFEKREHKLLGEDGFEKGVDEVAAIEKTLGIYDLAQFTPGG
jgi:hemerythrin-like domain-containing protein